MRGRDLFGVFVRAVAFGMACWGAYTLIFGVLVLLRWSPESRPVIVFFVLGLIELSTGVAVLTRAERIVRFTYGPEI